MAIFQKAYRGYDGQLSSLLYRPWVIFRYALADIFSSRIFIAFFALCFVPSAAVLCVIYMRYNLDALMQFEVNVDSLVYVDAAFFLDWVFEPQMFLIFVLIMFVGPTLVSPDLRNNALPLFLSRPINSFNYVLGKFLVLLVLGSAISWVPSLILIFYQGYLAGGDWMLDNMHLPLASLTSSLAWISSLSMLSLAISAVVKVAQIARLVFFALTFVCSALGSITNEVIGGWAGHVFSVFSSMDAVVESLYGVNRSNMPTSAGAMVLIAVAVLSLFIVLRRIRANEVAA